MVKMGPFTDRKNTVQTVEHMSNSCDARCKVIDLRNQYCQLLCPQSRFVSYQDKGRPKMTLACPQLTAGSDASAKCNATEASRSRANDFDKLTSIKPLKSEIRVN